MPTPLSNVRFGTTGGIKEAGRQWGYTPLEVIAGRERLEYYQEGQNTYSLSLDIYQASGITRFPGGVPVDSFTAISISEEELITGPHQVAADPRGVPAFGQMWIVNDYLMITHKTVKTSLTMRGELPDDWKSNKRGTVVGPYEWNSEYGDFSLYTPESFLGQVGTTERVTDIDESTVEMSATVASEDATAQTHLVVLDTGLEGYVENLYSLSMNSSLSPDGAPEKSYTITNYMTEREA